MDSCAPALRGFFDRLPKTMTLCRESPAIWGWNRRQQVRLLNRDKTFTTGKTDRAAEFLLFKFRFEPQQFCLRACLRHGSTESSTHADEVENHQHQQRTAENV